MYMDCITDTESSIAVHSFILFCCVCIVMCSTIIGIFMHIDCIIMPRWAEPRGIQ